MRTLARLAILTVLTGICGCAEIIGDGRTVLRIATWGGAGADDEFAKIEREILDEFERQNPDLDLRMEYIPGSQEYVRKMLLNTIAKAEPDLCLLDASSAAVFIENGVLMDLAPLIAQDPGFRLDDYWPNVVDIARRGDQLYAIPKDFTPMVMYYNRRLFDEAGVPYPKEGWTFEEFLDTARRLTDPTKGQYGFKFANWMPGWIMWLWNNGGDVLSPTGERAAGTLDSEPNAATLAFLKRMVKEEKVAPDLSQTASMGVDLFTNGQAAMEINGHWALVGYRSAPKDAQGHPKLALDDVGVVSLPTNTGKSVTVMYEAGWAIGKHCRHPEAAWRFVKYMTSRAVQERYARSGLAISARKDVSEELAKDPREAAFVHIVPSARPPWGAKVEAYNPVEAIGQNMMNSMLTGSKTIEQALKDAASEIDEEFRKQ